MAFDKPGVSAASFRLSVCALWAWCIVACGHSHELPDIDCATVTVPTYAEVSLLTTCSACHSSALQGASRAGAPAGINYDTWDDARIHAEHGAGTVFAGTMPPGGQSPDMQKQAFYAWALCGTPQ